MIERELVGSWSVKGFFIEDSAGRRDWRSGAHGLLIYASSGHMSVSINSEVGVSPFLDSVLFYSGTFQVRGDHVFHWVTNATDPNRIGKEMVRESAIVENLLLLTARGDFGTATLQWEKLL